jgi:hypothetical protein
MMMVAQVIINAWRWAVLTISTGYDPEYLTRAVATWRENYYLSAVAEHGEPPGIWTGAGCPELGLAVGSQLDPKVMDSCTGRSPTRATRRGTPHSGGRRATSAATTPRSPTGSEACSRPSRTRPPSAGTS